MNVKRYIRATPRIITAVILLQTLFFKFGIGGNEALEASQAIFSTVSASIFGSPDYEAVLRIGTGLIELMASILILLPAFTTIGAFFGAVLMIGALGTHLFVIGLSVDGDNGVLMISAIVVLICCVYVLIDEKEQFKKFISR